MVIDADERLDIAIAPVDSERCLSVDVPLTSF